MLVDPTTGKVRYIGQSRHVDRRYSQHLRASQTKTFPVALWIRGLVDQGLRPSMSVIDSVSEDEWEEAEKDYIAVYRELGCDLLNVTSGGQGWSDPTGEIASKISRTRLERGLTYPSTKGLRLSEAGRANMSKAKKGKKPPAASLANLSLAHRPRTQEEKTKIANRVRAFYAKRKVEAQ